MRRNNKKTKNEIKIVDKTKAAEERLDSILALSSMFSMIEQFSNNINRKTASQILGITKKIDSEIGHLRSIVMMKNKK